MNHENNTACAKASTVYYTDLLSTNMVYEFPGFLVFEKNFPVVCFPVILEYKVHLNYNFSCLCRFIMNQTVTTTNILTGILNA